MTSNAPPSSPSFRESRFYKVLGRIDEESAVRSSLLNMTSQDSSPRSSSSSDSSGVMDWLTPMSLESYATNHHEKKGIREGQNSCNINSNININHNITIVNITNVEDSKMDAAASIERRQDSSSPIPLTSQAPSLPPYTSLSSLQSSSQDHHRQQEQRKQQEQQQYQQKQHQQQQQYQQQQHQQQQRYQQQQKQQQQKVQEQEQINRENEELRKECEQLESIMLQMRTEGNILQMRTSARLKNYQTEIERATDEKERLENKCNDLEDHIWSLRNETRLRQESIWEIEGELRLQQKQQRRRGN